MKRNHTGVFVLAMFVCGMSLIPWSSAGAAVYKASHEDVEELEHAQTSAGSGKYIECYNGVCHVATKGHPQAQTILGQLYEQGIGVEKDLSKASFYYRKAAQQGVKEAQTKLGMMLYEGRGLAKDPKEAAKWLKRAAKQDVSEAQYQLGKMYLNGEGVGMDLAQGSQWLRKASANGFTKAEDALAGLPQVKPVTPGTSTGGKYQEGMKNIGESWKGYSDLANTLKSVDQQAISTQ